LFKPSRAFLADSPAVEGLRRVSKKKPGKAPICAALASASALWTTPLLAQSAHVENRCPRLSEGAYEELDARVLLLLKSDGGARPVPAVVCTASGAWVEWDGQRYDILGRGPIADEVVDIVETELHGAERTTDADPKTTEAVAIAAGQPVLERGSGSAPRVPAAGQPADRIAQRAVDARGGGVTLGIETELPSSTVATAVGPSFDFGTSAGPLMLGGHEAFRFTIASRRISLMDFEAALAYGAPLDPDKLFGAVARFGAEWMIAYPEGNSSQAAVVPVADVGLRMARSFGLLGLWLGADAHFRLATLTLRSRQPAVANDVGGSFSVGVSFVDWSRK
jgi:hypothetical protein